MCIFKSQRLRPFDLIGDMLAKLFSCCCLATHDYYTAPSRDIYFTRHGAHCHSSKLLMKLWSHKLSMVKKGHNSVDGTVERAISANTMPRPSHPAVIEDRDVRHIDT